MSIVCSVENYLVNAFCVKFIASYYASDMVLTCDTLSVLYRVIVWFVFVTWLLMPKITLTAPPVT